VQGRVGSFIMFVPGILLWELSRSRFAEGVRAHTSPWLVGGGLAAAVLLAPVMQGAAAEPGLTGVPITPATAVFLPS
jgi:hypothetical protein